MDEITPEMARKVLDEQRRDTLKQCQESLNKILEEYGCRLDCQLGIVDGRIVGNVVLVEGNN